MRVVASANGRDGRRGKSRYLAVRSTADRCVLTSMSWYFLMAVNCFNVNERQDGRGRGVRNGRRDGKMKGADKECDGKKEGRR